MSKNVLGQLLHYFPANNYAIIPQKISIYDIHAFRKILTLQIYWIVGWRRWLFLCYRKWRFRSDGHSGEICNWVKFSKFYIFFKIIFPYSIFIIFGQTEENGEEVTKILHQYTKDKLSCFGELALMYVWWVISVVVLSFHIIFVLWSILYFVKY